MIHLIQLLLPLYDENQQIDLESAHTLVRAELTRHFGRLTVSTRLHAGGRWMKGECSGATDAVVIYEVVPLGLDAEWWDWYLEMIKTRFHLVDVNMRALPIF